MTTHVISQRMKLYSWHFVTFMGLSSLQCDFSCSSRSVADPSVNWSEFTRIFEQSYSNERSLRELAVIFGSDPAIMHECRMGLAALFYRLSHLAIIDHNDRQASHDMNQLAMAMVWDVSRSHITNPGFNLFDL
jgi:hypothetical protein